MIVSPGSRRVAQAQLDGSMPSAAASLSIWASWAKQVCTAPKPRMAPHGGLLVRTARPIDVAVRHACRARAEKHMALASTALDVDA